MLKGTEQKKVLRVIDANFNRTKEGLRVCEDLCRFIWGNKKPTEQYKRIRHQLTRTIEDLMSVKSLVAARDILRDVGKKSINVEMRREDVAGVFYANSQRTKESIRVLEEFSKLFNPELAQRLKRLRYQVYALEKEIISRL